MFFVEDAVIFGQFSISDQIVYSSIVFLLRSFGSVRSTRSRSSSAPVFRIPTCCCNCFSANNGAGNNEAVVLLYLVLKFVSFGSLSALRYACRQVWTGQYLLL